jgi:dihydrofolate reductase
MTGRRVVLVAAVAANGVIGRGGGIPWRIREDMQHFKETTRGHTLVIGRRTYESIGRPLPDRTTVVVTRDPDWSADGVLVADSVKRAIELARDLPGDVMVGGGTGVYEAAMPYATHQVLTEVHRSPVGDTYYPAHPSREPREWRETRREDREGFSWVWWERVGRPPGQQPPGHWSPGHWSPGH